MRRNLLLAGLLILAAVGAPTLRAQGPPSLDNDFRNVFSLINRPVSNGQTYGISNSNPVTIAPNSGSFRATVVISGTINDLAPIILSTAGRSANDIVEMRLNWDNAPAHAGIQVRNASSGGTLLLDIPAPGYPSTSSTSPNVRIEFFRYTGTAWARVAWPPRPPDLTNATPGQFENGTAFGGWINRGINSTANGASSNSTGATTLIYPQTSPYGPGTPSSVRLESAILGRPMVSVPVSYLFGQEIPAPLLTNNGTPVPAGFYQAEPSHVLITSTVTTQLSKAGVYTTTGPTYALASATAVPGISPPTVTTDSSGNKTTVVITTLYGDPSTGPDQFYYSPHSRKVYATQPGPITIKWKETATGTVRTYNYVISGSPVKIPRKMYWTENGFNGPRVSVAGTRVNLVNIIYNTTVPAFVSEADSYKQPNQNLQLPLETKTVWFDAAQKVISTYNKEGRVFVEYLGNQKPDGLSRDSLGVEIIEVAKEIAASQQVVDIGDVVPAPDGDSTLKAAIVAGNGLTGPAFLYDQISQGGTKETLYAIRQTIPQSVSTAISNEVLIYWEEPDPLQVYWPKYYAGYVFDWPLFPTKSSKYSVYARQDQSGLDSAATGVQLDSANTPTLVYQDDPANLRAVLTAQNVFYTNVTVAFPTSRALLRYTNGDDLWFERVYSMLDTTMAGYGGSFTGTATGTVIDGVVNLNDAGIFLNGANTTLTVINPATGLPYTLGVDYTLSQNGAGQDILTVLPGKSLPKVIALNVQGGLAVAEVGERIRPPKITQKLDLDSSTQAFATGYSDISEVSVTDVDGTVFVEGTDYALDAVNGAVVKKDTGAMGVRAIVTFQPFDVGYIRQPKGTAFNAEAYKDPFVVGFDAAAKSSIIGVNALPGKDQLEVWWYTKNQPAGTKIKATYWPSSVQTYKLRWPATSGEIVLASNAGSGELPSLQATGKIYYQNDATKPGFNPNEEHALMLNGRAWALRDDLNVSSSSQPYVLVSYTESDGRPSMSVFHVVREKIVNTADRHDPANIIFEYGATAGTVLQAPMPLPLLPPPSTGTKQGSIASYEYGSTPDLPAGTFAPTGNDANFAYYQKFTWIDRKGTVWVYRGPHGGNVTTGTAPSFKMRYFYKTMPGFFYPSLGNAQPPVGTVTPYLRPLNDLGTAFAGDVVTGKITGEAVPRPQDIVFTPTWPDAAPELRIGQTLTVPTLGLPAVRGQTSAELIYQQSIALDSTGKPEMAARQKSARLFDPTVKKAYAFGDPNGNGKLGRIPDSVKTSIYLGKTYFPNLPPHLSQRLFFDPNEGQYGTLSFKGDFINAGVGDPYLLLNVMSDAELATVKALCVAADPLKARWDAAINGLAVTLNTYIEDPAKPGTYVIDTDETKFSREEVINGQKMPIASGKKPQITPVNGSIGSLAEISYSDTAVDSYAVSASGGGQGYVVLAVGNGRAFTPAGEPVSLQVFKVSAPLNRGELKVINSTNPLDEKLTLQHSGDFAGHPEDYDFEWRYAPPADGLPPVLYTFAANTIVGNSSGGSSAWNVIPNPPASYANLRNASSQTVVASAVSSLNLMVGGSGYTEAPAVKINGGGGSGATATAVLTDGTVTALTLTNEGYGYTSAPVVTIAAPINGTRATATASIGLHTANLPNSIVINNGQGTAAHGVTLPNAFLRRTFTTSARPLRLFLSMDLDDHVGAVVYVNGVQAAVWKVPGKTDSPLAPPPATTPALSPLSLVFEVDPNAILDANRPNTITADLYTDAIAGALSSVNFRLEGAQQTENLTPWISLGASGDEVVSLESQSNNNPPTTGLQAVQGKNRHIIQGTSILTLTDNWFIMRYRARQKDAQGNIITPSNAAYQSGGGWSSWTNPQLAEGWIKRALSGINPFNQRIKDLFNNAINTDVSLIEQAGKRWEGDIPLSLANINDYGLIEIYETILRRGKMLSIDGTPAINYDAANDALLLAAGYLNDLYMLLGNEAYADAGNPTIAFNTEPVSNFTAEYGDVATSLFAFKGQVPNVLEEELALLRGRDDFLQPGTRTAPVYNRLFWNYTRGIDSGEAVYALNYNIKDVAWDYFLQPNNPSNLGFDGAISAADAAKLYPQGHGDAYGHYLTALTNYYSLLTNPNFSWTPRVEAVQVLGAPVSVDYFDERKFAAAAAALARTASQTVNLTYRQAFKAADKNSWSNLHDGKRNSRTTITRDWGVDDWAARGGQGAFFHWVTANSLLPAEDSNTDHAGIQKIDRTTVPELAEIVEQAKAIQQTLDNADARMNPLGVDAEALTFDISPAGVDAGKTHYEQIYERATTALQNAQSAFNNAKGSTQFLREQEDSLASQRAVIDQQEQAFTNQLIEIYGTPYPDDVGPGKTYEQGYMGPDLLHSLYVDITEDFLTGGAPTDTAPDTYTIHLQVDPDAVDASKESLATLDTTDTSKDLPGFSGAVDFNIDKISGDFRKPAAWGRRLSPGRVQTAVSNYLLARQNLAGAVSGYEFDSNEFRRQVALYQTQLQAHLAVAKRMTDDAIAQATLDSLKFAAATAQQAIESYEEIQDKLFAGTIAGLPMAVGTSTDPSFAARLALGVADAAGFGATDVARQALVTAQGAIDVTESSLNRYLAIDVENAQWKSDNAQLIYGLREALIHIGDDAGAIDTAARQFDQARRDLAAVRAEGDRVQQQRLVFRQRAAAIIQGFRTRDFAFRAFRDEALEKYRTLFDLASRYTYLSARAYDYETGLLDQTGNSAAAKFYEQIVQARALGVITNGQPNFAGSTNGDPGLSGVLAQLSGDWSVVKTRLGFNNPSRYQTTFSLRTEKYRILPSADGDQRWHDVLASSKMANLTEDPDVRRYCLQGGSTDDLSVPGFVIPFQTTITAGYNFFGAPLAGGDHNFTSTSFATKIRSSGIAFQGYVGMDSAPSTSSAVASAGGTSPASPNTAFTDPQALSATPYIYLIPAGADSMRAPALGDSPSVRTWQVADQAIPLPFNISGSDYSTQPAWVSAASLAEPAFAIRKHPAFRAIADGGAFPSTVGFTNTRLIGRSVWNSQWKIVIPGNTLLNDPAKGVRIFSDTVKDIKLHLETYSYSGN